MCGLNAAASSINADYNSEASQKTATGLALQLGGTLGEVLLDKVLLALLGQILQRQSLGLGKQESREYTRKPGISTSTRQ